MSERAQRLHIAADRQITDLTDLVSRSDEAGLRRPCSGREKLGDGTIAATVQHTADNYQRIAAFVQTSDRMSAAHTSAQSGGHRVPGFFMGVLGHRPPEHADHHAGAAGGHGDQYTADNSDLAQLLKQLAGSRRDLTRIAELTDNQLDAIPPDGSFRFCDGQRTLEQVLESLIKHQAHQVQAVEAAFI